MFCFQSEKISLKSDESADAIMESLEREAIHSPTSIRISGIIHKYTSGSQVLYTNIHQDLRYYTQIYIMISGIIYKYTILAEAVQ